MERDQLENNSGERHDEVLRINTLIVDKIEVAIVGSSKVVVSWKAISSVSWLVELSFGGNKTLNVADKIAATNRNAQSWRIGVDLSETRL